MANELSFLEKPLNSHHEIIARAREIGKAGRLAHVAVAAAEEDDVLAALYACRQEEIAEAILVGNRDNIRKALETADVPEDTFEIKPTSSDEESAELAAELAASGQADIVMKGFIKTSTLLKTLLRHESGLRDRELVSHSAVLYVPRYNGLLNITDGGTLVKPTLSQKLTVIANAYRVMRAVGHTRPRIALLAPFSHQVYNSLETQQAVQLQEMIGSQWDEYLEIRGPMQLQDVKELAEGRNGETWKADVLLANTVEEGNITVKTMIQFGGAIFMGVIAGAKVPISLVSRSDSMMNKQSSIALAACLADYQQRGFRPLPTITI